MTLEKESGDPIAVREHEQFTAIWASIAAGAAARDAVVADWHASFVEAYQQGLDGTLEPNSVFEPKHKLLQPVPDVTVRGYFLARRPRRGLRARPARPPPPADGRRRLPADRATSHLDAFHPYGDPAAATDLPAGTYWIPLAQGQKHWIQSMLNEETWIPFDVTFDVTAWSNPLLMDLEGGWSGESVEPAAAVVPPVAAAGLGRRRRGAVGRAVRDPEQHARLRGGVPDEVPVHEVWHLPFADVDGRRDRRGPASATRDPIDVLVMPDGYRELRPAGARRQGQARAPRLGQRRRHDRRLAGRRGRRREGGRLDARSSAAPTRTRPGPSSGSRSTTRARSRRTSATRRGSCTRTT